MGGWDFLNSTRLDSPLKLRHYKNFLVPRPFHRRIVRLGMRRKGGNCKHFIWFTCILQRASVLAYLRHMTSLFV